MSISALTSSSATTQLNYLSKTSNNGSSGEVHGGPPPGRPDGGRFVQAIASALQQIGVTSVSGSDGTDTSTASAASATSASSDTNSDASGTTSTDGGSVAQALGSFLQSLMGALHAQGAENQDAPQYGAPPQGGPGAGGGPGRLASDLQSLMAKLGTDSSDSSTGTSTSTSTSTDSTSTDSTSATSDLESAFKNLLDKLGGSSTDSGDSSTRLASFLQALSSNLSSAGTSGNLINTTV